MSVFFGLFCKFLLIISHSIFSLYLSLKFLKLVFLKFIYNLINIRICRERKFQLDSELIVKNVNQCTKIPKHMTLALGNESVSYADLVQIIVWTLPTGIPVLSFYDHKNGTASYKLKKSTRSC